MKTISIRQLHERTGKFVRGVRDGEIAVTDRGRPVAILKAPEAAELPGKPFPRRRIDALPRVRIDSAALISAEREDR